jgi:meso-butanediol dehydrogenase / (S,S)-butanediol dehydrogenase / diacetyl reductase
VNTAIRVSRGPVENRLTGKVVLVTGVGSGQGREVSLLFARAGASVVGCDINPDGLSGTKELTKAAGVDIDLAVVDASDDTKVRSWVEGAAARYGGIDVLYNNGASAHFAPFAEMTLTQWHETLRLELDTVFIPSRAVWQHLITRGGGSIINIASIAGMLGVEVGGATAHCAGKGGVIAFTRQLAAEGAAHWIRVNSISPGTILTPAVEEVIAISPDFRRVVDGMPLLPRRGYPADIAYTGLFLASDEASYITGANFPVDGGVTAKLGGSFLR